MGEAFVQLCREPSDGVVPLPVLYTFDGVFGAFQLFVGNMQPLINRVVEALELVWQFYHGGREVVDPLLEAGDASSCLRPICIDGRRWPLCVRGILGCPDICGARWRRHAVCDEAGR